MMTPEIIIIVGLSLAVTILLAISYYEYKCKLDVTSKGLEKEIVIVTNEALYVVKLQEAKDQYSQALKNAEALANSHNQEVQDIYNLHNEDLEELADLHTKSLEKMSSDYRAAIEEQNEALATYEKYMVNLDLTINHSDKLLKELDVKGSFVSDDEIGFFFNAIKDLQNILNNFKIEKDDQDEDK